VLPEMAATGYVFPDRDAVAALAEEPDGPTFQSWSQIAAAQRCWIVGGFPEKDGDRLYNSALVIDPTGARRFVYRKTTLFDADIPWAEPGNSGYHAFETDAGRVGVGICMDLNDDGFLAWVRDADLKALAFPTNWVESTPDELHTWVYWAWRMRGIDAALLAANTWGKDGAYTFTGESVILHRDRALAALPPSGNGVVRGTLP
jgi:N-carbamoylputrescine amidase